MSYPNPLINALCLLSTFSIALGQLFNEPYSDTKGNWPEEVVNKRRLIVTVCASLAEVMFTIAADNFLEEISSINNTAINLAISTILMVLTRPLRQMQSINLAWDGALAILIQFYPPQDEPTNQEVVDQSAVKPSATTQPRKEEKMTVVIEQ